MHLSPSVIQTLTSFVAKPGDIMCFSCLFSGSAKHRGASKRWNDQAVLQQVQVALWSRFCSSLQSAGWQQGCPITGPWMMSQPGTVTPCALYRVQTTTCLQPVKTAGQLPSHFWLLFCFCTWFLHCPLTSFPVWVSLSVAGSSNVTLTDEDSYKTQLKETVFTNLIATMIDVS